MRLDAQNLFFPSYSLSTQREFGVGGWATRTHGSPLPSVLGSRQVRKGCGGLRVERVWGGLPILGVLGRPHRASGVSALT